MHKHAWRPLGAAVFMAATGLTGCGGGGGDDSVAPANQVSVGSLTVSVSTTGNRAVNAESGVFYVDSHTDVTLRCNVTCTAQPPVNNGVTVSGATTQSDGWLATLDFSNAGSSLDISLRAADGSTVLIRLRPLVGKGTATWALGPNAWTRRDSTQNRNTSTAGPSTGIAVNSTSFSNCKSGPYECSTVSVHWYGHSAGTFTIDPNFLTRQTYTPGTAWVNVKATGGTANDVIPNCTPLVTVPNEHYHNTDYRPTAGTIRVTLGSDGLFRVTTDAPLTVYKQPDSENRNLCIRSVAAPNAPASMSLQLNSVF